MKKQQNEVKNSIYLPQQFFCANYIDFKNTFLAYLEVKKCSKVIIVSDGVYKKSSVVSEKDLSQFFYQDLALVFEEWNLAHLCSVGHQGIHANENILLSLRAKIAAYEDPSSVAFVALGSGSITDLLKHALYLQEKKDLIFVSIPTALTVTAFTSHFSVIDIQGVKKTRSSKSIDGTFWIEPLLQAAPPLLNRGGFGDLCACFFALTDWQLRSFFQMDASFDPEYLKEGQKFFDFLKNYKEQENFAQILEFAKILGQAGCFMSLCQETTPFSGWEHTISHALDFLNLAEGQDLVLHGTQVALCSLYSARAYEHFFNYAHLDLRRYPKYSLCNLKDLLIHLLGKAPLKQEMNKNLLNEYVSLFLPDVEAKWKAWQEILPLLKHKEFQEEFVLLKKNLQQYTICSETFEQMLEKNYLPTYPEATVPSTHVQQLRWALRFSPFVRQRFTLGDFILFSGGDPCLWSSI